MTDPCIDAELLAAWGDGTLDPRTAAGVEQHAAQCARCQAMLAAFVRAEPDPSLGVAAEEARAPWWRFLQIRWVAPLAVAATALAIWVAIPTSPRPEGELVSTFEAPAAPQQPPAPPAAGSEPVSPGSQAGNREKAVPPADGRLSEATPAPAAAREEASDTRQRERGDSSAQAGPRSIADAAPAAAPPASAQAAEKSSPSGFSPVLADGAAAFASREGGVRWRISAQGLERSTDGGAAWTTLPLTGVPEADARRAAAPAIAAMSAAPGAGVVAGDAPTAAVCWLVGLRGAVWITTDGGATFRRVTVTGEPDLRTVTAQDARSANVTAADGRTFRTTDGGSTWTLTSP